LEYRTEPAMGNNEEFEKTLISLTKKYSPLLATLLEDPKLSLIYEEVEQSEGGIPSPAKIFIKGRLLPYSSMLLLHRKDHLTDVKLMLPFWYSLPIITAIIAFFKELSRKKKVRKSSPADSESVAEELLEEEKDRTGEIKAAAQELEIALVPQGYTMDSYLEELETRWSRLIDKQARENLIEDVKSLIRDNLRRHLKIQKQFKLTQEAISQMARNIITRTPSLASLSGRDSLILYSELYLIKLLGNLKQENIK